MATTKKKAVSAKQAKAVASFMKTKAPAMPTKNMPPKKAAPAKGAMDAEDMIDGGADENTEES